MRDMKMIGPVVKALRLEKKMTQEALALAAEHDSGNLSKFERGLQGIEDATLDRIAAALETTTAELLRRAAALEDERTGSVSSDVASHAAHRASESVQQYVTFGNPEPTGLSRPPGSPHTHLPPQHTQGVKSVPVFSNHHVSALADNPSLAHQLPASEHVPALPSGQPLDFAWHVTGDDMTAPAGELQSYPQGSIAYFDPTLSYRNGDCVLAIVNGEVTFTRLVLTGGTWLMSPLNTRYPTRDLPLNTKVLAVAIGCLNLFRQR